jgi:LacI family transcriptional regulator
MNALRRVVIVHAPDPTMDLVLAGIDAHRRAHPGWVIRHQYRQPKPGPEAREPLAWNADGWLSVGPLSVAVPRGVPWVSLHDGKAPIEVEFAEADIGRLAGEHLATLRPTTVAIPEADAANGWWHERWRGCVEVLTKHGITVYPLAWRPAQPIRDDAQAVREILALPGPRAIFAVNDWFAMELSERLQAAGLRVPADVALLGADDLPRAASLLVPLSSVQVPHQQAGALAAALLSQAMAGGQPPAARHVLRATTLCARASTDAVAMRDPAVAAALAAIAARATGVFSVEDAVAVSQLGRRSLEQRFRRVVGRSVLAEIQRVRCAYACELLADHRLPVADIAHRCGYADIAHFSKVFRAVQGLTPSAWRQQRLTAVPPVAGADPGR